MNIGVNAAPEAQDGALDVNEGAPTRGTMLADDPDDTNLRYEITKQPDHGTLELINGARNTSTRLPLIITDQIASNLLQATAR